MASEMLRNSPNTKSLKFSLCGRKVSSRYLSCLG
jgi:hypothetical protein